MERSLCVITFVLLELTEREVRSICYMLTRLNTLTTLTVPWRQSGGAAGLNTFNQRHYGLTERNPLYVLDVIVLNASYDVLLKSTHSHVGNNQRVKRRVHGICIYIRYLYTVFVAMVNRCLH